MGIGEWEFEFGLLDPEQSIVFKGEKRNKAQKVFVAPRRKAKQCANYTKHEEYISNHISKQLQQFHVGTTAIQQPWKPTAEERMYSIRTLNYSILHNVIQSLCLKSQHNPNNTMAFEFPTDLIRQLQKTIREDAGLSSYNPMDPTLPPLPSPAYPHCKGLLCESQSLICVYCGKHQKKGDVSLEPISFKSTFGCQFLLESLGLNGSVSYYTHLHIYTYWAFELEWYICMFNNYLPEHVTHLIRMRHYTWILNTWLHLVNGW